MAEFSYKAKDRMGRTIKGVLTAETEMELAALLKKEKGQYLITSRLVKPANESARRFMQGVRRWSPFGRVNRRDLQTFFYNISALVAGGISLPEALMEAALRSERPQMRRVIEDLHGKILEGLLLSEAMRLHPEAFPETHISIVQVGETSGNLPNVLDDILRSLDWESEIAGDVRQAFAYPVVILSIVVVIWIFLMNFVVPRMVKMLETLNVELPAITQFTILVSSVMRTYWYLLILCPIVLVIAFEWVYHNPAGRLIVDRIKLSLPIFGNVTRKLAFSNFAHYLSVLYGAGIGIVQALESVERVLKNRVIAQDIAEARQRIIQGVPLVKALEASPDLPPVVLQMLRIGEATGRLDESLKKVCLFYDRETKAVIKQLMAVIQPVLIVGLAGGILLMALSMYLPFFKMIAGIKGVR